MQTRIVVSTANPVTEICDGQAYARYYLCFYLFPATDYCLKPWLRKFFRHLQQAALFPFSEKCRLEMFLLFTVCNSLPVLPISIFRFIGSTTLLFIVVGK